MTAPTDKPATFCAQFKNNIYGTDANSAVRVKVNGTTNPGASAVLTSKTTATGEPVPWTIADYNNAATFCQNIGKTTALKIGVDDFNEQSGINGTNTEAPIAERVNLALRQTATQSNTLNGFIASQGNDGNQRPDKTERSTFGTAVACKPSSGGHAYWEVEWDLRPDNDNYIDKIIIYPALFIDEYNKDRLSDISTDGWKLLTDTEVKLFNNGALVSRSPITPNGTNPITINLCGSGICPQANKVRIEQTDKSPDKPGYTCLALAEVEAIRANMDASPAGENGGNDAGSATVATFEPAVSEVTIGSTVVNNFSNAFSLETNKTQNNLSVRLKLFKTTVGQQDGLVSFSTVFAPGSLKINDITFNESQMTEHTLIYANNVTLTANSPLQISQTGTVSSYTAGNTSYKLITDVLNSTGAVIATQTTSFKIQ
ncbi:MAG: hypothetical protein UW34_C0001G0044 [Parcubacteria group bacterium GW2011_GWA2_44_15]|nr:MAG: hypothetical protein UW34_C0001G0044 [Parcubacteria group bacterium GW2011_GWA2_44_15]